MADNQIGIGGQERESTQANEGIAEIPKNRTLMALKFTSEAPVRPEIVEGLTTVEAVFGHFQPACEVEYADKEGGAVSETLRFNHLGDFGRRGIVNQSQFLKELDALKSDYQQFAKTLKSNRVLQKALNDATAREAYLGALQTLINQLEEAEANSN